METRFPCAQCGAFLTFALGTEAIRCDHCGHENTIEPTGGAIEELDLRAALARLSETEPTEETQTIKCSACAAEFSFDPNVHADACPFCDNAIVVESGQGRHFKPRSLLPFVLTEDEAHGRLAGWLKGLWFAPNRVKKYARSSGRLTGIYTPYWTYDSETESRYSGERGTAYTVTQSYTAMVKGKPVRRTRQVTKIRWAPVQGTVWRNFDDVLVLASNTLPRKYTENLDPWRLENLVPYQEEYLSGFRSERYQVGLDEGFQAAEAVMERVIRGDVNADIGGDAQRIHNIDTRYGLLSFKHVLLPVWIAAYRYGGKSYNFVVNGQTGEVQGERPYSVIKITLAVLLGLAVAAGIAFVVAQNQ